MIIALEQRCFNDQMESYFGDEVRKSKILSGAILQLPRLGSGPVITTNFDGLLEEAFRSQGHPFELVVTGSNPGQAIGALQQDRGVLVKIHGEWNRPNDRVLTLTEYQRAYGASDAAQINFENHLPKLLQSILSTRPALFLGCSLSQDRTMAILKRIASNYPESAHYAIIEQPLDPDAFQKRAQYLSGQGIRPIWYPPGQHQLIEPLVSFLGDQIPQSLRRGARKGKRGNIPARTRRFIGRQAELAKLGEAICENRLVTIKGGPGYGKTQLALEFARTASDLFDDEWFVQLGELSRKNRELVAQRVAAPGWACVLAIKSAEANYSTRAPAKSSIG